MFQDYPDILTPVQASKALRIGTKTFYNLIRERKFGHIRIGKKILVPRHCLAKVLTVVAKDKTKNASSHRIFPLTDETLDIFKAIKKKRHKTVPLSEKLMKKTPMYSNGLTADPIRRTTSPTSSASCPTSGFTSCGTAAPVF